MFFVPSIPWCFNPGWDPTMSHMLVTDHVMAGIFPKEMNLCKACLELLGTLIQDTSNFRFLHGARGLISMATGPPESADT